MQEKVSPVPLTNITDKMEVLLYVELGYKNKQKTNTQQKTNPEYNKKLCTAVFGIRF